MDDSCAVCAETLEWIAYGPCGHKDVCSTCVARLRFICNDRRCCICKTESNLVFVTKALGDYTRMINDFSVFPSEVKEGRIGSYWYHEDTQAIFDDLDHYRVIKAMCRLSCSVCDKMEEQTVEGARRKGRFRNIDQLKGHLFHKHKLLMCSLCLEGRKVFICEQKLYTRLQLSQHISTGDCDVDGTESERGGFMGHPMCEFCRTPYYGDNELYTHMSTEHYTCHICQRQHPGQYEYYKNYDDLEMHFRRDHYLCEDEACLAKKFIVFQNEAEMKRHNAIEHGGRMSRSKRNAALQIPTSFRYRRANEDSHRGRGRSFRRESSDDAALSMAIQASFETGNVDSRLNEDAELSADRTEGGEIDPIIQPFESLATSDSETPSRYLQALSQHSRNSKLEESSFPPLPSAPGHTQQRGNNGGPEGVPRNTIADHLRRQSNKNPTAVNSDQPWPPANRGPAPVANNLLHRRRTANLSSGLSSSRTPTIAPGLDSNVAWPVASRRPTMPATNIPPGASSSSSAHIEPVKETGTGAPSYPSLLEARGKSVDGLSSFGGSVSSSKTSINRSRMSHPSSAPNINGSGSFETSEFDFPSVSTTQTRKPEVANQVVPKEEDVHTANKSLVEKLRTALGYDQDKFNAFKDISGEYRQGLINAEAYLAYVDQYGLSHLVLELARLCPDPERQTELVQTYTGSLMNDNSRKRIVSNGQTSKKGKGKLLDAENGSSKDNLADNFLNTVKKLQSSYKPLQEDSLVLSKDGYRTAKGKSRTMSNDPPTEPSSQPVKMKSQNNLESSDGGSDQCLGDGDGNIKQKKKVPKFLRARLGDGSVAALSDLKKTDPDSDPESSSASNGSRTTSEGLPVCGVWRKGGGQKLFVNDMNRPQR